MSSNRTTETPAGFDTAKRAESLAQAAMSFPELGPLTADSLLDLVAAELGHRGAIDGFQDYRAPSGLRSRVVAPRCILHIVAGNTPLAALQSLIRGLLLGSKNLFKLPSSGIPEIDAFIAALPSELSSKVTVSCNLDAQWLKKATAVIVFGNDDTVHHFRQRLRPDQVFVAHGHRLSFAVVFADPDGRATRLAARDVGLFNQQGCLSPHDIYVDETAGGDLSARQFAADLAQAMAAYEEHDARGDISASEAADISALRDSYQFRAANDDRVAIWHSTPGSEWTVIFEEDPQFAVSPLNRVVFVKPLPAGGAAKLDEELRLVRPHLSSIALHPFTETMVAELAALGASRLCALGEAQRPHPLWHQDGLPQLAPLVRWQDLG